jgi:CRP-like cAMP-binding protein
MPKLVPYKAGSFVYFAGDAADKIFVLQSGVVDLVSTDIKTNRESHDVVQRGEFFGVKSALGNLPREESASVVQDASVMFFSVSEFEAFALQNPRIVLKMLKVFSNQLRTVNKQLATVLLQRDVDTEQGLYSVGENLFKAGKYKQALYVFNRYLKVYPDGKNTGFAKKNKDAIERKGISVQEHFE